MFAHSKKKTNILLLICLFAFLIRISFFIILQPFSEEASANKVIIGDSVGYHARALSIINTGTLSSIDPWWTPGYVFFLTFIYFIFGIKPWIALLAQIFIDIGTLITVYLIANELFETDTISLIAAFLYSVSFPSAFYSIRMLSETTFTFVLALAVLIFIKSLKRNDSLLLALSGVLIGMAIYTRAVALYLPAVLLFILLFDKNNFGLKLRNAAILLIALSLTLFPWQFRNLKCYGDYAMTTKGGVNLIVNASIVKAEVENISRQEALDELGESTSPNPFEKSKTRYEAALSYISKHPAVYVKCQLRGMLKMFLGTGQSGLTYLFGIKTEPSYSTEGVFDTASKIINNARNELPNAILFVKQIIEYFFFMAGLLFMYLNPAIGGFRQNLHCNFSLPLIGRNNSSSANFGLRGKKIFLLLFVMIILYFAAVTGPIGYSRFRVPIIPFYLVISAAGIFGAFKFIGRKYS